MTTISADTASKKLTTLSFIFACFAGFVFFFFPTPSIFAISGDILSIEKDDVSLMAGPGSNHSTITELKKNEKVYEKLRQGSWVVVEVALSGQVGWIHTSSLSSGTNPPEIEEKQRDKPEETVPQSVVKSSDDIIFTKLVPETPPPVSPVEKPQKAVVPSAGQTESETKNEQPIVQSEEDNTAKHSANSSESPEGDHFARAGEHMDDGNYKLAVDEFRKAIQAGNKHPLLYFDLASALFEIGKLDEALVEMTTAVTLAPSVTFFHSNLGKLYYKKREFETAEKHLYEAIRLNLGQADAYCYLAKISFAKKNYHSAWLLTKMAYSLGFQEEDFTQKLLGKLEEPDITPWKIGKDNYYLREILVESKRMAEMLLDRIHLGEPFDLLAAGQEKTASAFAGGYLGSFELNELRPVLAESVKNLEIMGPSIIVETDSGFHILQRIAPFNKKLLKNN